MNNLEVINQKLSLITGLKYDTDIRNQLSCLLTSLNIDISNEIYEPIEELLTYENNQEIVDFRNFKFNDSGMYVWRGDICQLNVDSIVNATTDQMLGCFDINHECIDKVIHTRAGPRLRMECRKIIKNNKKKVIVTHGYCLPCKYVIHCVDPIYQKSKNPDQVLINCYKSILKMANNYQVTSIALCCISTEFPINQAAEIAINTVKTWISSHSSTIKSIIFCVYTSENEAIYQNMI